MKRALCALLCMALSDTALCDTLPTCLEKFPQQDAARLKCYDDALPAVVRVPSYSAQHIERSYLTRVWNLDDENNDDDSKLGRLQPYRQNYLLLRDTNKPNALPSSGVAGHSALLPIDSDHVEAKYLISVKADIGEQRDINLLGLKTIRLWGAYTQQSHWQILNTRNSSPFRETNYSPELMVTFGTNQETGLKLINLGLEHQSNGRPLPDSRSWNRVYALGGWEWNNRTSILTRAWWRIPEARAKDDNPDIVHYLGIADMVLRWETADRSQAASLLLRNNFQTHNNRGFAQLDWAMPLNVGKSARVHLQLGHGYGESLIDYNYRQTTLGLGLSFREW
ncbi:MAG: phospholipase A [Gallionella sp.]